MTFTVLAHLFSTLLDLPYLPGRSDQEKDLEILLVRKPLRFLHRNRTRPPRLSWWEQWPREWLSGKLVQRAKHARARLSQSLPLFTPETVLRWHRDLVRQKWTFRHRSPVGRPRIAVELGSADRAVGKTRTRVHGSGTIEGELRKLGSRVGRSTIRAGILAT